MKKLYSLITLLLAFGLNTFAQPANNDCANAITVFIGDGQVFSTIGATTDGPGHPTAACYSFGNEFCNQEIWYSITAVSTGSMEISTCSMINYDSRIGIYNSGATCPLMDSDLLACNDDGPGCDVFSSLVNFPVIAGETYLFCIGGYDFDELGEGTFSIAEIATPVVPNNDLCAGSEEVTLITPIDADNDLGWTEGTNLNAASVVGGLTCLTTGEFWDVWYSFDPGSEDLISLNFETLTEGAEFHIELWKSDCSGPVLDVANGGVINQVCFDQNDTNDGLMVLNGFQLAPGEYKLRVVTQITNFVPGDFRFQLIAGEAIGINEFSDISDSFQLYPNPTTGQFAMRTNINLQNSLIQILDIQGRLIHEERKNFSSENALEISMQETPSGIYFVRVYSENNEVVANKKLIVE